MRQSQSGSIKESLLALATRFKMASKIVLLIESYLMRRGLSSPVKIDWHTQVKQFLVQYQRQLIWIGVVSSGFILILGVISPYAVREQNNLLLRPAQWAYLQNLAKESQFNPRSTESITRFDEIELQRLRTMLANRGIKPSVLILSAGNSPKLEFQANGVMFSTLLDVLDEMRTIWRVYPSQLTIHPTDSAGVVNVSSYLLQYSVGNLSGVEAVK